MKTLNADIKSGKFHKIYLLCGEEEYLKQSYRSAIRKAMIGEDTMNLTVFNDTQPEEDEVIDIAQTMPMFSDRRLIMISDSGWFKSTPEKLCKYLDTLPEYTCLVFTEKDVDKRSRLYKKVKELGYVCELSHPEPEKLSVWALSVLTKAGKKITKSTMELFLSYTGNDMENIYNELQKLTAYVGDREAVSKSDVEKVTTVCVNNRIFDMVRFIVTRQTGKAMELYEDLLTLKEPPLRILYLIARQFDQLLLVKEMIAGGGDARAIGESLKLQPFIVSKLMKQARGFDRAALHNCVSFCVELEEAVKTGNMPERIAVELMITGVYTGVLS